MNKKVLLLGNKFHSLEVAEQLLEQGYVLYAESRMAHYLNQNMIPASAFAQKGSYTFDLVIQS